MRNFATRSGYCAQMRCGGHTGNGAEMMRMNDRRREQDLDLPSLRSAVSEVICGRITLVCCLHAYLSPSKAIRRGRERYRRFFVEHETLPMRAVIDNAKRPSFLRLDDRQCTRVVADANYRHSCLLQLERRSLQVQTPIRARRRSPSGLAPVSYVVAILATVETGWLIDP